jgi:hypothetical protein
METIVRLLRCAVAVGLLFLAGCGADSGCATSGAPGCDELARAHYASSHTALAESLTLFQLKSMVRSAKKPQT